MTHTPGPWLAEKHDIGDEPRWFIQKSKVETIASMNSPCVMYNNAEADALLIAAAPDLLVACRRMQAFHDDIFPKGRPLCIDGRPIDHTLLNEALDAAESAIKKAEGADLIANIDRGAAARATVRRVLAEFYRAPLSMSSVQPILDLAVELNPELAKEQK